MVMTVGDEMRGREQGKEDLILEPDSKVLFVACLTGLWTGSGVVALNRAIHAVEDATDALGDALPGPGALLVPVIGGVTVSLIQVLMNGREGLAGKMRAVLDPVLAAVTLGTGFSLGPEGPSVEIGKSLAKTFRRRAIPERCFTALLAAGSAAGISAGFNAPISGVFFALETVLERETSQARKAKAGDAPPPPKEALDLAVVTLASVLAAIVSQIGLGAEPAMSIPEYRLGTYVDFPLYLVLGFLSGGVSVAFTKSVSWFDESLASRDIPREALPVFGGIAMGLIACYVSPEVTYQGFENFNKILSDTGSFTIPALGVICLSKIVATSISKASGLVGGIYAPTLFLGAATGSLYGKLLDNVFVGTPLENLVAGQESFALVGMASTLSAVCRVPLTSTLLLFELTRDYSLILPTLGGVALSFLFVSSSEGSSLFSSPARPGELPAASGDAVIAAAPASVPGLVVVGEDVEAAELLGLLEDCSRPYFVQYRGGGNGGGQRTPRRIVTSARVREALVEATGPMDRAEVEEILAQWGTEIFQVVSQEDEIGSLLTSEPSDELFLVVDQSSNPVGILQK
ncbi:chloride channel protein [Chloropicon primus]|uniref:Chloride channel protein n=1 Tax=Chloropicon primus TaxID=1764295 RepID=A0A5B8MJC3_9CHLO|nr:chloride channel protein [Chloropicon primus]UPQ99738.1 chloride channel protein [Chloropicon primus]|eukprot:QDZ20527.1 chloride channel protein [Chloropicon primus]